MPDMCVARAILARTLHQPETFMIKALRGEAVVHLPRTSNNAEHGRLRLARKGENFSGRSSVFESYKLHYGPMTHHSH